MVIGKNPPLEALRARRALHALRRSKMALAVALLSLTCLPWWLAPGHTAVLNVDEARYLRAAALGPVANWLDAGSLGPQAFVAFVLAKVEKRSPPLPSGYEEGQDPLLLRNLHPPLVAYALWPFSSRTSERQLRFELLLGAGLLVLLLQFAYVRLSSGPSLAGFVMVAVLGLWAVRLGFSSIHTHGWLTIWATLFVLSLQQWISNGKAAWAFVSCVALAGGLITLHSAVMFLGGGLVVLIWHLRSPRRVGVAIAKAGGVMALLAVLAWPALLLKLSYVKIFAYYAYLLLRGQEWSNASDLRGAMLWALLPLLGLGLFAAAGYAYRAGVTATWLVPLVCAVFYGAAIARQLVTPGYALPALAPLIPLVGVWMDALASDVRRLAVLLIGLALTAVPCLTWVTPDQAVDRDERTDIVWLRTAAFGQDLLADYADVYRHYVGTARSIDTIYINFDGDLVFRKNGMYRAATGSDVAERLVLVRTEHMRPFAILEGCPRTIRPSFTLFACP